MKENVKDFIFLAIAIVLSLMLISYVFKRIFRINEMFIVVMLLVTVGALIGIFIEKIERWQRRRRDERQEERQRHEFQERLMTLMMDRRDLHQRQCGTEIRPVKLRIIHPDESHDHHDSIECSHCQSV